MKKITPPLIESVRTGFKAGEEVSLTGTVYTARDQAHQRLCHMIAEKKALPFEIKDSIIYYAGPTPARQDGFFGSCGPTTSSRMDSFTPLLLEKGLGGMIGKGRRSEEVRSSILKNRAVYFLTIGGGGAYLAKCITSSQVIAFQELGPETVYRLEVKNFPLMVGIDSNGEDIYGD